MHTRLFTPATDAAEAAFSSFPSNWRTNLRGDLTGGFMAAIVSIPFSMGFGALAFAPLGPAYVPIGIVAGLLGVVFLNLVAIAAGAKGSAVYAPRSLVAFMIGSIALHSVVRSETAVFRLDETAYVAAAMFAMLSLAGLFQLLFGAARLGKLVRYIPIPVMAGFQNAAALLILASQVPAALGLPRTLAPGAGLDYALEHLKPLNLLVFAATLAIILKGRSIARRVPPALLGLVAGTLLYYVLAWSGLGGALGATVGPIPLALPDGSNLGAMLALAARPGSAALIPTLVAAAFSLAVVASLDVLLSAKVVEGLNGQRVPGNTKLLRAGAANFIVPLLGGLAGGVSIAGSAANASAGASTSLSLLVKALLILAVLGSFAPAVTAVPLVVIAAVLTVAAMHLFDKWTLELLRKIWARDAIDWRAIALDLAVIAAVAVLAMAEGIVYAVLVGIGMAVVLFAVRMSRSVVRAEYFGNAIHSRRARDASEWALLERHGGAILLLQLDGPLFFGSAESLLHRIESAARQGVRYVVLDMHRVSDMDSTAARVLIQAHERARESGAVLVLGADWPEAVGAVLRDIGVLAALTRERFFADADHALEWAEDRVIEAARAAPDRAGDYPLAQLDLLQGFTEQDREAFRALLVRREHAAGELVFREGSAGDELFIILQGSASVRLRAEEGGAPAPRSQRLATFAAGTVFGEMALLDREARSASVVADGPLSCYVLERAAYERIVRERHPLAIKLLTNLGKELSSRLRRANRMLVQLEQ